MPPAHGLIGDKSYYHELGARADALAQECRPAGTPKKFWTATQDSRVPPGLGRPGLLPPLRGGAVPPALRPTSDT